MIRIGCDAICVQLFVELRKHGQTEYQILSNYWFYRLVFESVPHMVSTHVHGCCTVFTLQ